MNTKNCQPYDFSQAHKIANNSDNDDKNNNSPLGDCKVKY